MKFIALDVETANPNMTSICSIGAAVFEGNKVVSEFYTLIDPDDYFAPPYVGVHGISQEMVVGSPTYSQIASKLSDFLGDSIVVTHTHFDRVSIHQASRHWEVAPPRCSWLDSAMVARRTWEECAKSGYGLAAVCKQIGYDFQHHHALEDAKAAGQVILAAMKESSLDMTGILQRIRQPINPDDSVSNNKVKRAGKIDGSLNGEVIVFTGALHIPRKEAADLAAAAGCDVDAGVTKNTTLLVVGDSDVASFAGFEKSAKHRKAEELILKGVPIRVIRETDFRELITLA